MRDARYSERMPVTPDAPQTRSRRREDLPERFKWNLTDIFPSWDAWESGYKELETGIEQTPLGRGCRCHIWK